MYRLKMSANQAKIHLDAIRLRGSEITNQLMRDHDLDQARSEHIKWRAYCKATFFAIFVEGDAVDKEAFSMYRWIPPSDSNSANIHSLVKRVGRELTKIESLLEIVPLMTEVPEGPQGSISDQKDRRKPTVTSDIRVFISHSSSDKEFAHLVVDLIERSIEIPDRAIRCTSVPGYKLDAGDDSRTVLRANIAACDVLLGLLTPTSLASGFVLMELGAAWGFEKTFCPLLAPGVSFGDMPGPTGVIHASRANDRSDIQQLINGVTKATGLIRRDPTKVDAEIGRFIGGIDAIQWDTPSVSDASVLPQEHFDALIKQLRNTLLDRSDHDEIPKRLLTVKTLLDVVTIARTDLLNGVWFESYDAMKCFLYERVAPELSIDGLMEQYERGRETAYRVTPRGKEFLRGLRDLK